MPESVKKSWVLGEPSTEWLECTLTPGFFSTEVIASATTALGNGFSLFVPTSYVHADAVIVGPTKGLIAVNVLDKKDDLVMVSLPAEPLESSQTVTVHQDQLKKIAA